MTQRTEIEKPAISTFALVPTWPRFTVTVRIDK